MQIDILENGEYSIKGNNQFDKFNKTIEML